jgi:SM-20-related protein
MHDLKTQGCFDDLLGSLADQLVTSGYAVIDDFVSSREVTDLQQEFTNLKKQRTFRAASTGHRALLAASEDPAVVDVRLQSRQSVFRTDHTLWFEEESLTGACLALWEKLERLKTYLNQNLLLGLWEIEGHFAEYTEGGFYTRHLDAFAENNTRVVSVVLYLNDDWSVQDGGALVLYPPGASAVKVTPFAGKLVCFMSETIEHEVQTCTRPRHSFAGWFRRR